RRAPATRGEPGATDDVRREDGIVPAAVDVCLLAERLVEVGHLVEGNAIDQDQVVARSVPAHGEVRELTRGDHAGQDVQRTEDVARAAGVASYLFTLQQHGV